LGSVGGYSFGRTSYGTNYEYTTPATTDLYYVNDNDDVRSGEFVNLNVNYQHKFEGQGHVLDTYFNVETGPGESEDLQEL
jgi:hypothetical protein